MTAMSLLIRQACFPILAVLCLSGCVTTAGGRLPDVDPQPPSQRLRLEETVGEFAFDLDGGKLVTSNKAGRIFQDEVLERWQERGWISGFEYVKSAKFTGRADREITLSGTQYGESSIILQVISGITLLVIPHYVTQNYDVIYTMRDPRTNRSFRAQASDDYTVTMGLLLFPFTPFFQGGRSETWDRIANSLFQQLQQQGAFDDSADRAEPLATMAPPDLDD